MIQWGILHLHDSPRPRGMTRPRPPSPRWTLASPSPRIAYPCTPGTCFIKSTRAPERACTGVGPPPTLFESARAPERACTGVGPPPTLFVIDLLQIESSTNGNLHICKFGANTLITSPLFDQWESWILMGAV